MSDFGSSNTTLQSQIISHGVQPPREKPATSDLEKFKRVIQKQISSQNNSSSEPQESNSPIPTNNFQQNHIPYNPNLQSIPNYLKEKHQEKENGEGREKEKRKREGKEKTKSRKKVSDHLENGVKRIKKGCQHLFSKGQKRRRLRL